MQEAPGLLTVTRDPFPHVVVDGWWDAEMLGGVLSEFPHPDHSGWRRYGNAQERKFEGPPPIWGPITEELFNQIEKLGPTLERAFGIPDLTMETIGGGYHLIPPGGYLKVHTDFNRSPNTTLYRRLNLLIYLNEDWQDEGGRLELWGPVRREKTIAPEFNRTVVFETSDHSWHGHPIPASRWRCSVAAYFFSKSVPGGYRADQSTVWHPHAVSD